MNEDSLSLDFQFDFPHTPPQQPNQHNPQNPAIPTPSDSSSSDDDENQPINIVPLDEPLPPINNVSMFQCLFLELTNTYLWHIRKKKF